MFETDADPASRHRKNLLVLEDGRVNGGDGVCAYSGRYGYDAARAVAHLALTGRCAEGEAAPAWFGQGTVCRLEIAGQVQGDVFLGHGGVEALPRMTLRVQGVKVAQP
ncbi:hypothetical protein V8Z80_19810 [Orrella sp. JC864]|uniref:hypothetical protein n=1 Tax=Orrella sp. JC864 TaxID=3120298 RepID=UPI0012BCD0E6